MIMKNTILLYIIAGLLSFSCMTTKNYFYIGPNESIEMDYPDYESYQAEIKNYYKRDLEISVVDKTNDQKIQGLESSTNKKVEIKVEKKGKLVIKNNEDKAAYIKMCTEKL
mgnify:CR=1 FL=1